MARSIRTAVIGDDHRSISGYLQICEALQHSADVLRVSVDTEWLPTKILNGDIEHTLRKFDAIWCGPWGPYTNITGANRAIRYARESNVPFLGTCAGFQHVAIEYARTVLGLTHADHGESNPNGAPMIISRLSETNDGNALAPLP